MFSFLHSPSALSPGSCMGHGVWILLAMTHLTLDFSVCSPLSQSMGIRLTTKSVPHTRPSWQPLWESTNKLHWRTISPSVHRLLNPAVPDRRVGMGPQVTGPKHLKLMRNGQAVCKECGLKPSEMETEDPQLVISEAPATSSSGRKGGPVRLLRRTRRQLKWDSYDKSKEGRTTTVAGFIDWGPTGTDSVDDDSKLELNGSLSTKVPTTTVATTTSTTARVFQRTFTVVTTPEPRRLSTTKATVNGGTVKPPKPIVETSGEPKDDHQKESVLWLRFKSCALRSRCIKLLLFFFFLHYLKNSMLTRFTNVEAYWFKNWMKLGSKIQICR